MGEHPVIVAVRQQSGEGRGEEHYPRYSKVIVCIRILKLTLLQEQSSPLWMPTVKYNFRAIPRKG